jgi:HEPN domain-containing protein
VLQDTTGWRTLATAALPRRLRLIMPDAQFAIPVRIRGAVLNVLDDGGVRRSAIIWELGKRCGFTNLGELLDFIVDRYGEDAAEEVANRGFQFLSESVEEYALRALMQRSTALSEVANELLGAIPDDMFVTAFELGAGAAAGRAFDARGDTDYRNTVEAAIAEMFAANGVPYQFEEGQLMPTLSPTASAAAVQPAVDVLDDPRLADARAHYLEALRRLQEPDPDEAVDEARQAVEEALLALIDAHGVPRPERHQANNLFLSLVPNVISNAAQELVLATPRFRNQTRAGHAGQPRVTLGEAQAAVASAAGSLLYLADKLPA